MIESSTKAPPRVTSSGGMAKALEVPVHTDSTPPPAVSAKSSTRLGRPRTCECGTCKKCKHREYMRKWYASQDMDARRLWVSRRDPEAVKTSERRRYEKRKNSAMHRCNFTTNNAIRDGKLVRQPCEVCGTTTRIHAHHEDHTKPLEVRWLCAEHHHALHMLRHLGLTGGNE